MTQQCKYDDQLLDYLYGELAEPERTHFAQHLASCSACAAQVESFGRVRSEYKNRPPIEPAGESMQRMTALLMQAATEHAAAAGKDEAASGGGGKILQFRSRGLRRILLHPAGGVMAVAAAALFWVVFRAQPGAHTGISGPTTFKTAQDVALEPAAPASPTGAAPAAMAPEPGLAAPGDKSAPAASEAVAGSGGAGAAPSAPEGIAADGKSSRGDASKKDSGKDRDPSDDFAGLRAKPKPAKELEWLRAAAPEEEKEKKASVAKPQAVAQPAPGRSSASGAEGKPAAAATLDLLTPAAGTVAAGKGAARPRGGEAQLADKNSPEGLVEQSLAKSAKKEAPVEAERPAERWAQPPPPPPAYAPAPAQAAPSTPPAAAPAREPARDEDDSVSGVIARTRDSRQQKVVEALANQELGSLGPSGSSAAQAGDGRYAQRRSSASKTDSAPGGGRPLAADAEEGPAPAATPAAPTSSLSRGLAGARDDGAAALAAIKDQLRRGQCAEANTALSRLERTQPTLHGLPEARAEWQSACAAPQVPQLAPQAAPPPADRRLANEALESPSAPAPARAAKLRAASPAPPKAPARAKSAPKAADRKAADALQ